MDHGAGVFVVGVCGGGRRSNSARVDVGSMTCWSSMICIRNILGGVVVDIGSGVCIFDFRLFVVVIIQFVVVNNCIFSCISCKLRSIKSL